MLIGSEAEMARLPRNCRRDPSLVLDSRSCVISHPMQRLTDSEKRNLVDLITKGKPLPPVYKNKLFAAEDGTFIQTTKEYRLVYEGKARREDIIAGTPEAPFQLVRQFSEDNPFPDGWRNMLIYGDNLLALKELYADQRGANRYRTRDRIKLIYIDPPFATKQDFMKDKEKAYRDKVLGAQFIEFLRRRLILLRELLADDGSIYVHLDTKKSHYLKAVLDETFGEENFRNEIVWKRTSARSDAVSWGPIHDTILFYTKSDRYVWNDVFQTYDEHYVATKYSYTDERGRFMADNLTAAGLRNGDSGKPWRGLKPAELGGHWKVNRAAVGSIVDAAVAAKMTTQQKLDLLDKNGFIYWPKKSREGGQGRPRFKKYLGDGVVVQDIIVDRLLTRLPFLLRSKALSYLLIELALAVVHRNFCCGKLPYSFNLVKITEVASSVPSPSRYRIIASRARSSCS
jgi:DNA methylase